MSRIAQPFRALGKRWDDFFHRETDPEIFALIRIAYAFVLLINLTAWLPYIPIWFGETGVLSLHASRAIMDPDTWTVFSWLPTDPLVVWCCYSLLLIHTILLLVGYRPRLQAALAFFWLVSFHHRNNIILDGEDTVFRLLCFYLILMPSGARWSVDAWRESGRPTHDVEPFAVWPLRLVQIQMTLIYASTFIEKLRSPEWIDGTALYFVSRLDDVFGKFPVPSVLFDSLPALKLMTWGVLAAEALIPLGLWIPRARPWALGAAVVFHLATDYAMNLFLFHWIMLVGLISFLPPPSRMRDNLASAQERLHTVLRGGRPAGHAAPH